MLKLKLQSLWALLFVLVNLIMAEQCLARSEHEIKAAYVYHFVKFVQWPTGYQKPVLNICTVDDAVILRRLEPLSGQTVNNQTIRVMALSSHDKGTAKAVLECSVVYIGRLNANQLNNILRWTAGQPTLVISDIEGFADKGGMIEFIKLGDVIRFNINIAVAKEANLFISSKLLELAHSVVR